MTVDDVGIYFPQRVLVEAESVERLAAHIRMHDIGVLHETMEHRLSFGCLKVIPMLRLPRFDP